MSEDFSILSDYIDRLVSTLTCVNCLFIGNYKLKDKVWVLITSILEQVRKHLAEIPEEKVKKVLKLKVICHLFRSFGE